MQTVTSQASSRKTLKPYSFPSISQSIRRYFNNNCYQSNTYLVTYVEMFWIIYS